MTPNASPHHLAVLGVVIVAAGSGERLGAERPKAFVELGERTLLEHAVRTVVALARPGQLVLVVPESRAAEALEIAESAVPAGSEWQVSVVGGGRERHESVRKGLDALREGIETVLVHDAARPLTPAEVFARVADEVLRTGDAVIPVLPVTDTLKRVDASGVVRSTADRRILVAAQTPQGFPRETLVAAHESAQAREEGASPANDAPTDDAEVVQRFGGTVRTVEGDARSHKLTTPEDLLMLEGLLAPVPGAPARPGSTVQRTAPAPEETVEGASTDTAEPQVAPDPEPGADAAFEPGVTEAETADEAVVEPTDEAFVEPEPAEPEPAEAEHAAAEYAPTEHAEPAPVPEQAFDAVLAAEPSPGPGIAFTAGDPVSDETIPLVLPSAPDPTPSETLDTFDRLLRGDDINDGGTGDAPRGGA